ncbi:beta-hydroxyacyl-ACP dehydratase [Dactylosporangium roseum]|uniref:Beta-hydroxyacyl-ACP dehydratase n=1 Tax=Dactylosporangium roseum TaxID=47989 RepID=A0ABY5YZ25_9ACTN|nr:3-hydroxyacyl-ACP dehydratase [Dactylosporangium roseum]UWZ34772.1 beta-hydroxyacyl-ACP dehydratase [Dactylosporangium roseum]
MRPTRYATAFDALAEPPVVRRTSGRVDVTLRVRVDDAAEILAGHYPGVPIMPGVLVLDAVQQAVGAACGSGVRITAVERVRFLSPLRPGDVLALTVSITVEGAVRALGRQRDGRLAIDLRARLDGTPADD